MTNKPIDKTKLVELMSELQGMIYKQEQPLMNKTPFDSKQANRILILMNNEIAKINSGEFDCEAVGSEWRPEVTESYYTPIYVNSEWHPRNTFYVEDTDKVIVNKGEAFKTESVCKQYMNRKGWYNDKEWKYITLDK